MKMKLRVSSAVPLAFAALLTLNMSALAVQPATAFTYQGRITDGNVAANGLYDFQCALYADNTNPAPITSTLLLKDVAVSNGLFLLTLDFDPQVFTGQPLYLGLEVKLAAADKFIEITPRQPITPTPYATRALWANSASDATFASSAGVADSVSPGGVTGAAIASFAVNTSHLANNVVINSKINDGAVTASKLASDAVTTAKIQDGAVTAPKIAVGAVGSTQIANGAVANVQLAAGAAAANLAVMSQTAVPSGGIVMSASPASTANLASAGYVKIGGLDLVTENWNTNYLEMPSQNVATVNPRVGHSTVWDGAEMIIWGGNEGVVQNTGARYNPVANTWSSMAACPLLARKNHVAVWTGSLMLVWGGNAGDEITFLGDGARYNPASDTWSVMATSGAPAPREDATGIWSGSKMVVWGGTTNYGFYDESISALFGGGGVTFITVGLELPTGGRYDPVANAWQPVSVVGAPAHCSKHSATWSGTEMLVFGGGTNFNAGRYNPSSDTWSSITPSGAPAPRSSHTAVWAGANLIVWGGTGWTSSNTPQALGSGARYNPAANSWTALSSSGAPSPRTAHSAVWTGSKMIVWGGKNLTQVDTNNIDLDNSYATIFQSTNTGALYDPVANSWAALSGNLAPVARDSHTAVWTGTEMLVWGGVQSSSVGGISLLGGLYVGDDFDFLPSPNAGARFNPNTSTWVSMAAVPTLGNIAEREDAAAVWTGTEMLVWGGENSGTYYRTGGRFDPVAAAWKPIATAGAPAARSKHTAVWTGSQMFIWGGTDAAGTYASGGRYNPATDKWSSMNLSNAPLPRCGHVAVWAGNEMLVWGGYNGGLGSTFPGTGGRYNPRNDSWRPMNTTNQPPQTAYGAGVWNGSEFLVWGGNRDFIFNFSYNSGGRYNPLTDSWVQFTTSNAPSVRSHHVAAWSGSELVVWGGEYNGARLNTGGRYNPVTDSWRTTTTNNAPSPRTHHTGVWTGNELIVQGGFNGNGLLAANDGGLYDPRNDSWKHVSPISPYAPVYAPVAFGNHCAVWTGRDMIVWGGVNVNYNNTTNYNATPYIYTPARTVDLMLRP